MSDDIDAEIQQVLALEAEREAARTRAAEPVEDVMHGVLTKAFARAEREHRRATENVDIQVFDCSRLERLCALLLPQCSSGS